jgi:hypothetical protein
MHPLEQWATLGIMKRFIYRPSFPRAWFARISHRFSAVVGHVNFWAGEIPFFNPCKGPMLQ